jgi:Uma2 family endonuclease
VLELRSPTDSLPALKKKMEEYIANGAQLGWLLDPPSRTVFIYRPGREAETLENPSSISGEPVLLGFALDVEAVWRAMERKRS